MSAQKIPLEPIQSSNLSALGYDLSTHILAVKFKSGDVYHYANVPEDVVQTLYLAESKGRAYAKEVKGKFAGQRMTGPCQKCGDSGWIGDTCEDCGCAEYAAKPEPVKHMSMYDDPSAKTRRPMTECGQFVTQKDLAPDFQHVTCETCLERLRDEAL